MIVGRLRPGVRQAALQARMMFLSLSKEAE
jgi:hypothetical protein